MTFSNCFLCDYKLSERAKICPKCGDPDPHHIDFLICKIRVVLKQCACPRYADGVMESYNEAERAKIFHTVCNSLLEQTEQEISKLKSQITRWRVINLLAQLIPLRGSKRLQRITFEHNSVVLALSDYLFSPLPGIKNMVQICKLDYLLRASLEPPFYLRGVTEAEDIKHYTLLDEAILRL